MRELELNSVECSPHSLVFNLDNEPVFLCLTSEIKRELAQILDAETPSSITAHELAQQPNSSYSAGGDDDALPSGIIDSNDVHDALNSTDHNAQESQDASSIDASTDATASGTTSAIPALGVVSDDASDAQGDDDAASAPAESEVLNEVPPSPRTSTSLDPRLSTPLKMRPKEIQERIRGGATIAELAEENDVTEKRIEPYAHPVLLERARVAEMAKKAHPVRDDGPARLTLWEILATAFAARGLTLTYTEWDAYRDPAGQWVIAITWQVGQSTNKAEYSYLNHLTSSPTAVPRNALAQELVDPKFTAPTRSFTTVSTPADDHEEPALESVSDQDKFFNAEELTADTDEDFLQHPTNTPPSSQKRTRKAHTPHWEDVLLGVRANTKRPRK